MVKNIVLTSLLLLYSCSLFSQDIRLFHIERNKNANIVCYDLNIENGKINTSNPINIYWDNLNKKLDKKLELTSMERKMAYGITINSVSDTKVVFTMKAYSDRPITISYNTKEKTAMPIMIVNGEKATLQKLYIFAKSPLYTSVVYVELFGKSIATQKSLYEKINNK